MKHGILGLLIILALLLALPGCAENDTENELEEYLMEIYGPYGVCKCLGDGKYYAIERRWPMDELSLLRQLPELEDWEGDVRMTLYPIENERDIYAGDEFVCRSEKSEYLPDETPQIIMENNGENTLIFRFAYYQLDYLYEGKWYAVHIGYYPYSIVLEIADDRLAGGEEYSYGLHMSSLDEWRRVEKPEVNEDGTMDIMDDQLELRPGRYRFSRRAKIEETGEVITLACEYDIVEAKKE